MQLSRFYFKIFKVFSVLGDISEFEFQILYITMQRHNDEFECKYPAFTGIWRVFLLKICQVVLHDYSEFGVCILETTLWRCGDEFECKYPAFTGISREIRCDLGEGDKARGGGVGGWGSIFIILSFSEQRVFSLYCHFPKILQKHSRLFKVYFLYLLLTLNISNFLFFFDFVKTCREKNLPL